MKQQSSKLQVFKIPFSKVILTLCVLIFALCGMGIGISIWRILRFGIHSFTDVIKYPFLIAVSAFCIVLVISVLIKSQYIVDKTHFITQYGFIKSKFRVETITALTLDTDNQKLTMNFGEQFLVLSVSPAWNEKLVRAILEVNPNVDYSFTLTDSPLPKDKTDKKDEK